MSKRSKSDLTGGSGDVNPQWLNLVVQQPGADVFISQPVPLPTQRLQQRSGKSLVLEILKVYWDLPFWLPGANTGNSITAFLSTKQLVAANITTTDAQLIALRTQGVVIDYFQRSLGLLTGGTPSTTLIEEPNYHDLSDGAGHGLLVATDTIYISLLTATTTSTPTGAANGASAKVLYRWKEVGLQEYIGIVQSQQ